MNTEDVHNLESFITQQCQGIRQPLAFFILFFLIGMHTADGDCALYLHKYNPWRSVAIQFYFSVFFFNFFL